MRCVPSPQPSRGARFVAVPDAGHMPPLEQPVRFNAALREFLLTTTP